MPAAAGLVEDADGGIVGAAVLVGDRVARLDLVIVVAVFEAGRQQTAAAESSGPCTSGLKVAWLKISLPVSASSGDAAWMPPPGFGSYQ